MKRLMSILTPGILLFPQKLHGNCDDKKICCPLENFYLITFFWNFFRGTEGEWINCGNCSLWAHFSCDPRDNLGLFSVSFLGETKGEFFYFWSRSCWINGRVFVLAISTFFHYCFMISMSFIFFIVRKLKLIFLPS